MSRLMHTHHSLCLVAATTLLCLIGGGAFAQSCDAPEPANFNISAPAPSVAPEAAGFSGVWAGNWLLAGQGGNRISQCARIHVSVVDSHRAAVAYCYGTRTDVGTAPQCDPVYAGVIRGPYLIFFTTGGVNISLQLKGPGTAEVVGDFPHDQPTIVTNFQKL
jgi:hypothetical protein